MFAALDSLKPHEVYAASGSSPRYALWGELLSTRALHLKAAGAVLDGYVRDTSGILGLNLPYLRLRVLRARPGPARQGCRCRPLPGR